MLGVGRLGGYRLKDGFDLHLWSEDLREVFSCVELGEDGIHHAVAPLYFVSQLNPLS